MKIKRLFLLPILLICVTASAQQATPELNLMPVPASVKFHPSERLNVDSSFKIANLVITWYQLTTKRRQGAVP